MKKSISAIILFLLKATMLTAQHSNFSLPDSISIYHYGQKEKLLNYFPVKDTILDPPVFKDPSLFLLNFGEPLLYSGPKAKEIFRFTWLRSIDMPFVITFSKDSEIISLEIKKGNKSTIDKDTTTFHYSSSVYAKSQDEWNTFQKLLKGKGFWKLEYYKFSNIDDGAIWILESTTGLGYHFVYRSSPGNTDAEFANACKYLIQMSKLNKEKLY